MVHPTSYLFRQQCFLHILISVFGASVFRLVPTMSGPGLLEIFTNILFVDLPPTVRFLLSLILGTFLLNNAITGKLRV